MNNRGKLLTILLCGGISLAAYTASTRGWGASDLTDSQTMAELRRNCPEGYRDRNGECLRTTFRSYYLPRMVQDGGLGSGGGFRGGK
ncbi:MAG: hypothetical protein NW241_03355 [Bacteroidia bacterium]|nr:hypothetical protein [Bacteroidia bacterium]